MNADTLTKAIREGDFARVTSILNADPGLVNKPDSSKTEPILAATLSEHPDHVKMVDFLIERGANVNQPAHYPVGHTPLHFAVSRYDVPLVKVLLSRGADVNAKNWVNYTPIYGIEQSFLARPPLSAFSKPNGYQEYMVERENQAKQMIEMLIERGAIISEKDSWGKLPFTGQFPSLKQFAEGLVSKQERRGLAEVSVMKSIPQNVTANISSFLNPEGKKPKAFLPGKGGRKSRKPRKTRRRRTLRKHK
jgi:ankyrin repeat protein